MTKRAREIEDDHSGSSSPPLSVQRSNVQTPQMHDSWTQTDDIPAQPHIYHVEDMNVKQVVQHHQHVTINIYSPLSTNPSLGPNIKELGSTAVAALESGSSLLLYFCHPKARSLVRMASSHIGRPGGLLETSLESQSNRRY
jgi:hypothetical protein